MKIKDGFVLNKIGDSYIAMATGETMLNFNAMISTNEVGAFIWKALESDKTAAEVTAAVCSEYDIDHATAEADTAEFIESLRGAGLLDE